MSKWERRYPAEWDDARRQRAERLAGFVTRSVQELRRRRAAARNRGGSHYPIALTISEDGFELLRRSFTHDPTGGWEGEKVLYVDGAKVKARLNRGLYPNEKDTCTVTWSGRQHITWLAPEGLDPAAAEVYEQLRRDGIAAVRAAELARMVLTE